MRVLLFSLLTMIVISTGCDQGKDIAGGLKADKLPENFDWRVEKPNIITGSRNTGQCAPDVIFAAVDVLRDRICIRDSQLCKKIGDFLSPQYTMSCYEPDACDGLPIGVSLGEKGTTTEKCVSYRGGPAPCPSKCDDGSDLGPFARFLKGSNRNVERTVDAIKKEIHKNGPILTATDFYSSMFHYKEGVWSPTKNDSFEGTRAIRIVGWGHDKASGLDYWICAMPWGPKWGDNGYIKIEMGLQPTPNIKSTTILINARTAEPDIEYTRKQFGLPPTKKK